MARLHADVMAVNVVKPSPSTFKLASRLPIATLGCLGGFNHKSHLAATTVSMVQVDSSYLFPESNGPYALPHYRYQQLQVPSRGQSVRGRCAHQNFFGSKRQFLRARRESSRVQVSSLKAVVCRMQDGQVSEQEREEARWLREEKRWLREEERWLREEARWDAERKALLEQSVALKEEIKVLKRELAWLESQVKDEKVKDGSISDLIVNLSSLLQSLNIASALQTDGQKLSSIPAQISSSASSATDISATLGDISLGIPAASIGVDIPVGQSSILESKGASKTTSSSYGRNKRTLKRGAEGDDVKAMQDALAKLGFYSGEDDMEYSTFSSGTDRAVRSWQATLGTSEDGIVTTELLIKLLGEETPSVAEKKKTASLPSQDGTNPSVKATTGVKGLASPGVKVQGSAAPGAKAGASVSPGLRAQSSSPEKLGSTFVEVSQKRVYLLGENRWEEPSRLLNRNGPVAAGSATATVVLGEKCFSCKGLGNMMCTECEGTGELNVEEQFLEWAEEGAKCPYCEGEGMLSCDVCDGKGVQVPS